MVKRLRNSIGNCSPSMVGHELKFNGLLFPKSLGKARSVCNLNYIENLFLHRQKVYQNLETVSCSPSHPQVLTPYYPPFATKSADSHSIDLTIGCVTKNEKKKKIKEKYSCYSPFRFKNSHSKCRWPFLILMLASYVLLVLSEASCHARSACMLLSDVGILISYCYY